MLIAFKMNDILSSRAHSQTHRILIILSKTLLYAIRVMKREKNDSIRQQLSKQKVKS